MVASSHRRPFFNVSDLLILSSSSILSIPYIYLLCSFISNRRFSIIFYRSVLPFSLFKAPSLVVIMKGDFGLSLLPLLAAASPVLVDSIHNNAAPVLSSMNAPEVPDSYIVVFKKHVSSDSATAHESWLQDIHSSQRTELKKRSLFGSSAPEYLGLKHSFNVGGSVMGYAGHFHEDVIEQVRRHPDVSNHH